MRELTAKIFSEVSEVETGSPQLRVPRAESLQYVHFMEKVQKLHKLKKLESQDLNHFQQINPKLDAGKINQLVSKKSKTKVRITGSHLHHFFVVFGAVRKDFHPQVDVQKNRRQESIHQINFKRQKAVRPPFFG